MQYIYGIDGMHCAACTQKVTQALERVPSVARAEVTLTPPQATVETTDHVPFEALRAAVASAGSYTLREPADEVLPGDGTDLPPSKENLYPLILIVAYLAGAVLLIEVASGHILAHRAMQNFMAGFFLVFSFFKLLDLRGFANTYRTYDDLAQTVPAWAWAYPFAELDLTTQARWGPSKTGFVL